MSEEKNLPEEKEVSKFRRLLNGLKWLVGAFFLLIGYLGSVKWLEDNDAWVAKKVYAFTDPLTELSTITFYVVVVGAIISAIIGIFFHRSSRINSNIAYGLYGFAFLSIILLGNQSDDQVTRFIVVYDNDTMSFHPDSIGFIEECKLADLQENLSKLQMVRQIDKNTILLSAVERPSKKWNQSLAFTSKLSLPIMSLQEVLEPAETNVLDISLSNFDHEICSFLGTTDSTYRQVRIIYEYGYEIAEKKMKKHLSTESPKVEVLNSVLFDNYSDNSIFPSNTAVIYLGSAAGLKEYQKMAGSNRPHTLIAPNWCRPMLKPKSTSSLNTSSRKIENGTQVCAVSSVFNELVLSDSKTWGKLLRVLEEISDSDLTIQSHEYIQSKIVSTFAKREETTIIHFQ